MEFLNDVIDMGYAEVLHQDQLKRDDGKIWYFPYHGVYHPKKMTLRVVFDCGAICQGTSLDSELLQGPDLTNSLIEVISRFRTEPIAMMADIRAMFHQARVSKSDADFLRFLWWPKGDIDEPHIEHEMLVHLFGEVSSPSCASFALRKTAKDNTNCFDPGVTNSINCNFYVDNFLKSVSSEQKAVQLVEDLTSLCHKG